MHSRKTLVFPLLLAALLALGGCATPPGAEDASALGLLPGTPGENGDPLVVARELHGAGYHRRALLELVQVAHERPDAGGLSALKVQVLEALAKQEVDDTGSRLSVSEHKSAVEALAKEVLPATYGLAKFDKVELKSHISPPTQAQDALKQEVSIHLKGADLSAIILALSKSKDINIIADQGIGKGKKLDIEVDDVPLGELLDYVERNFDVSFHLGDNTIWVTRTDPKGRQALVTRVFHLHKGVLYHASDWEDEKTSNGNPQTGDRSAISFKATELASGTNYIEQILLDFVPFPDGARLLFDKNTHALFVRNSPENMTLVEEIIETLDVSPVQVLIEARFIEVAISDLREIGLEWILGSGLPITQKTVMKDGRPVRVPKTQIDSGEILTFEPYTSDSGGTTPLGPKGAFGEVRTGNPSTADKGLNLAYSGVLTEPAFQAVLHALDISGKGKTLSVPRVTTINNSPAKLRHGQDLRFYEEFQAQAFNLVDSDNKRYTVTVLIPKGKPSTEELGITLVAVPSVGKDSKTVNLLLTPTISKLDGFVSYQDTDIEQDNTLIPEQVIVKLPIIARREIQTKVVVESGQTVVMGGLIETVKQKTTHGVPILSSIPLLGSLFTREDTTEQRKNLLIFVTATVVTERGETLLPLEEEDREPADSDEVQPEPKPESR